MLPLVQMHPPVVRPPPTFDDLATLSPSDHDTPSKQDGQRPSAPPYRRLFPIRISQPYQGVALSPSGPYTLDQSHCLRRKTPNGTIDAGYDGSPTQLSPGPPPLKHMVLPIADASLLLSSTNSYMRLAQNANMIRHSQSTSGLESLDHGDVTTSQWFLDKQDPSLYGHPMIPTPYITWHSTAQPRQHPFLNVYQPLMRAAEYNVRAFCPPPASITDSSTFGQVGWYKESTLLDPGYTKAFSQPLRSYTFPDPTGYVSRATVDGYRAHVPNHISNITNDFMQSSQLHLQDLCLESERNVDCLPQHKGHILQPSFKEKALRQAHRHYLDLLSHLQTTRRLDPTKHNAGLDVTSKFLIYPKPPRPKFSHINNINRWNADYSEGIVDSASLEHGRDSRIPIPNMQNLLRNNNPYHQVQENPAESNVSMTSTVLFGVSNPSIHRSGCTPRSFASLGSRGDMISPIVNARRSLDVLKSLCEQSSWEWIDGMLLGGCLQFGLEQYEDALKWFSRVVALDSSHVEAITNMAATMYCLDRQDEAERQWLRAISLCPSCLEATEHLVGLLYKDRGQEAVEIISYVQQCLRLVSGNSLSQTSPLLASDNAPSMHDSLRPLGFGSSGYALPGSENGRILALVHAKGTILYSLKDIKRASEAFEEAVLISVGRHMTDIHKLVRRIHAVLSTGRDMSSHDDHGHFSLCPLLLPPEKARQTAQLVFSGNGELPGLASVLDGPIKRAAVQTTSNALLSLAKIFQDAMSSGNADSHRIKRSSGVGDILALYYLSLSLQESPSTANNVGILLAGVQQTTPRIASILIPPRPTLPGIIPGSGLALALAYYNYGLRLDPNHVHLHTNLGSLLKDIGQLDLAIQMYERAVSCDGSFDIALTNLANAVKDRGRINDAITYYRRAVNANPGFAEAVCGLLTALNSVCDWRGRGGVLLASGHFDRWHVDDQGSLVDARTTMSASGLTKRVVDIVDHQLGEASQWGCNVLQQSTIQALAKHLQQFCHAPGFDLEEALRGWACKPWEGSRLLRLMERATRVIMWSWYRDQHILSREVAPSDYLRPQMPLSLAVPPAPTVLPFHTFTSPLSAKDIRSISQRNAMRISCSTFRSPWLPNMVYPPPPPPNPQLNIGYVSSDFNNHPLAHLMQSVFGLHDPRRARAFCYATTPSDKSVHRLQIEREAPVFRDVSSWSAENFIEQIVRDQIHILVNLNGYTRGARNEIFAARPAPIQMSFMGFAGSLGAEWCDYILADTIAIPPITLRPWRVNVSIEDTFRDDNDEDELPWVYSENIIFCRDTFFCCDHAQSCNDDERDMTWNDEEKRRWGMRKELFPNLSDDAIILANFNQLYKIEPTTFRSWLRILARTPKAVLWLLRFPELGETNLRRTAQEWAGAEVASRLIFTDVAPKNQHISRARICDLFLDTPECNAHTTAADVLWSSTPLLTFPRYPYKMCSRMAASILQGALPKTSEGQRAAVELITRSDSEYEDSATELASGLSYRITDAGYGEGSGRLAEMRRLLWESKWQCALFNTRRWVKDVEEAYDKAWQRWVAGEGGDIYL